MKRDCQLPIAKLLCIAWPVSQSKASRKAQHICHAPGPHLRAFTLIELMVVVAIMGIVMTIAIPTIYQQLHPESMRKAVSDVMEACGHARARAILDGMETDLVIRPADRQFDITAAASPGPSSVPQENSLFS